MGWPSLSMTRTSTATRSTPARKVGRCAINTPAKMRTAAATQSRRRMGGSRSVYIRAGRRAECRIREERLVSQRLEKGDEVVSVRARQGEPPDAIADIAALVAAGGVVIDDGLERGQAAVVHIGRRERDVPERRRAEAAHVVALSRHLHQPPVTGRIAAAPVDVVQRRVVKEERGFRCVRGGRGVRQVEARVALAAVEPALLFHNTALY